MSTDREQTLAVWKKLGIYFAFTVIGAIIVTLFIRGVWGSHSPAWYFVVGGGLWGSIQMTVWLARGWL